MKHNLTLWITYSLNTVFKFPAFLCHISELALQQHFSPSNFLSCNEIVYLFSHMARFSLDLIVRDIFASVYFVSSDNILFKRLVKCL